MSKRIHGFKSYSESEQVTGSNPRKEHFQGTISNFVVLCMRLYLTVNVDVV